ncbi:aminoglycoside phosphotransferase family protein [Brachybacterium sp. YJGR34]|uniref:aminoglycoside phosphotransferase family protein n=1 Tax=Brachybacterium sp. YJGR34 TaxID=2059911 RepID=UPI001E39DF96|nr:aminoglycoside phosphotransferase family protein [Brachybacterium sp. YJGR34]
MPEPATRHGRDGAAITVPPSFRAMPRWWHDVAGREWLDRLPGLVSAHCARWGLVVDGPCRHGSNALVVPVLQGSRPAVLRLSPPGDDIAGEVAALAHWDGRGVVKLLAADPAEGSMLLERLDPSRSLATTPLPEAAATLGRLARELAVPAPEDVLSTSEIAAEEAAHFERRWQALHEPVPEVLLTAATAAARRRADCDPGSSSVDGDLHYEQVLTGERHRWTVVDPVLLCGDIEYDIGRALWSRLDEMPEDRDVHRAVEAFVAAAGVPRSRARDWVLVRSMSYLLWGLERGLTEDPPRCHRLLELFA